MASTDVPANDARDDETQSVSSLAGYMLAQLDISYRHYEFIVQHKAEVERHYFTLMAAALGLGAALVANDASTERLVGVILVVLTVVGVTGTYVWWDRTRLFEVEMIEQVNRYLLNAYFRAEDPARFDASGMTSLLERHRAVYYWMEFDRRPWRWHRLIGPWGVVHLACAIGGIVGLAGVLGCRAWSWSPTGCSVMFGALLLLALVPAYLAYSRMYGFARSRHIGARAFCEPILQARSAAGGAPTSRDGVMGGGP